MIDGKLPVKKLPSKKVVRPKTTKEPLVKTTKKPLVKTIKIAKHHTDIQRATPSPSYTVILHNAVICHKKEKGSKFT